MKKIYLFLGATLVATAGFAQYKAGNGPAIHQTKNQTFKVTKTADDKAAGDSLMYFDSEGFFLMDAQDNTDFALENADIDGNTAYGNAGWPTPSGDAFQFSFFNDDPLETPYTTPGGDFFPNDLTAGTDSAYYIAATSWFSAAPLQANNWWSFGPITIPANTVGNTFSFHDKHNPMWTDSYDVYLVDMANLNDPANPQGIVDVTAMGLTPDFTKTQISNANNQADTSWTLHTMSADAFVGSRMFVFFNHDANDGDVLQLDEMYVTEGTPVGIEELNTLSFNVFPNPSTGEFNINLSSENSGQVNLTVKNVVGQTVINKSVAVSGRTKETISLTNYSKGIYFLTIDNKTVKLIVE